MGGIKMVTPELIQRLKQVNVSVDKDKTAKRVKDAFSAATRKKKSAIEALTGQKRTSIYRVFKTGNVSAKLLLPLAEILNITPFWFTGESDDMEKCSDALILSFLDGHGYKFTPKQTPRRKSAAAEDAPAKPAGVPGAADGEAVTISITINNSPKMREAVEALDADNAAQLLNALYLRAKGGGNAEQYLDVVKLCLLS
jgi:hypothetical protein